MTNLRQASCDWRVNWRRRCQRRIAVLRLSKLAISPHAKFLAVLHLMQKTGLFREPDYLLGTFTIWCARLLRWIIPKPSWFSI